jgi:antitoxin MazE
MQTTVQKWGNSLAVRIPVSLSREIGIKDGSSIDISVDDSGTIMIKPTTKKYMLSDLLKRINSLNLHGEVQTGDPIGNEIW